MPEKLVTETELAEMLGVDHSQVAAWVDAHVLEAFVFTGTDGRILRFTEDQIQHFLSQHLHGEPAELEARDETADEDDAAAEDLVKAGLAAIPPDPRHNIILRFFQVVEKDPELKASYRQMAEARRPSGNFNAYLGRLIRKHTGLTATPRRHAARGTSLIRSYTELA